MLVAWCVEQLADYKKPRIVELARRRAVSQPQRQGAQAHAPRGIPGRSLVIVAARNRGMVGRAVVVATEMTQTDRQGNFRGQTCVYQSVDEQQGTCVPRALAQKGFR